MKLSLYDAAQIRLLSNVGSCARANWVDVTWSRGENFRQKTGKKQRKQNNSKKNGKLELCFVLIIRFYSYCIFGGSPKYLFLNKRRYRNRFHRDKSLHEKALFQNKKSLMNDLIYPILKQDIY